MSDKLQKISNCLLSACAGIASFVFTLMALLVLHGLDEKFLAALTMGTFALLIVWIAAERPNSGHARAVSALIDRLLAVGRGDLSSPAPRLVKREMPALAAAVDTLFDQVRSSLDNVSELALYDPVTSLPNRVHFKREAEGVLARLPVIDRHATWTLPVHAVAGLGDGHLGNRWCAALERAEGAVG